MKAGAASRPVQPINPINLPHAAGRRVYLNQIKLLSKLPASGYYPLATGDWIPDTDKELKT
jgi:hypothetical protein